MSHTEIFTYRYESFGGILHLKRPSALVWVDKDYMRSLGYPESPLWDEKTELLSAPTEVHASVTGCCSAGCKGCYVDSYKPGCRPDLEAAELGYEGNKRVIDTLADARVFHLALGGGESLEMPWFFDVAEYAAARRIIPNLTTNGFEINEGNVHRCRIFGQINVSIDGIQDQYHDTRGIRGFDQADKGLSLLRKAGSSFGINTVVSRKNFDQLEDIVRYAKKKKASQIELLRFKPAGRGIEMFEEMDLTPDQTLRFFPLVEKLTRKYRFNIRLDCSFMPMVFAHQPDRKKVDFFSVAGCLGGDMLMGIRPDGKVNACSFAPPEEGLDVFGMTDWWRAEKPFSLFRNWHHTPAAPCDQCQYLEMCRGGCHVVAQRVFGDMNRPDPGCPMVKQYYARLH